MKLLEAYILRRVWQMFLTALLPVLAIIWTTQVLARINLVTDSGQSIGSFMKLASLILPTLVPTVMPFALVIGITQTLTAMNNDSELAVIDAAGASRSIITRPILTLAVALCAFSFVMSNFVDPRLRVSAREMIAAAYADLLSSVIEEKTFRRIDEGLYVQISERLSGRVLKGLLVADSRDPAFDLIYYAREGAVDETGTALVMHDGEVQRKARDGNVSIVRFDSYSFDLSELSQTRGQARYRATDRNLLFLLSPDPADPDVIKAPGEYRAELHKRLSEWLFPLVVALISLVVAGDARSHREARLHPMALALTLALGLYWLSSYTVNLVESGAIYIPLVYAVPLVTIGCCWMALSRGRALRLPAAVTQRGAGLLTAVQARIDRLDTPQGDSK
ncbi:LPS export ABC transporter permease LptF [Pseudomonas sp. R2.Fl]|nr:LPS export ABC transporter permease LptF [Pseudomonas sp. R2.Fl]